MPLLDGAEAAAAILRGDSAQLRALLSAGLNPNSLDQVGESLLKLAAGNGALDLVQMLLEAGADVNFRDPSDATPLDSAVIYGRKAVVDLLLSHGAEPNSSSIYVPGWTPLIGAATMGNAEIVQSLLNAGAYPNAVGSKGRTPFSRLRRMATPK